LNFTNSVRVERTPHDVFAYLAEFENVPRWNYAIERTWKTSPGPVGVGSTYHQERTVPRRAEESFEVVEFAPDSRLAIAGTLGPFPAHVTYVLQSDDGGTTVVNDVGERSFVGANSVVAGTLPDYSVAVGSPARVVKQWTEEQGWHKP